MTEKLVWWFGHNPINSWIVEHSAFLNWFVISVVAFIVVFGKPK